MNKPIKVLWLDDEAEEIIDDFRPSAQMNRVIIINYFKDAQKGKKYIRNHHDKIDAIIIDGYFLSEADSSKKKDKTALKETVDELNKLLYKEGHRIPFCIFTGYLDDLKGDSILSDVKVFSKGKDDIKMFDYLKKEVSKNEDKQLKINYEDVFDLFDKNLLPDDKEEDLLNILKKVEKKAKYNDDDAFNPIRKMYEALIDELHDKALERNKYQDVVPEKLYDNRDNLNIMWSWYYLSGHDVKQGENIVIKARQEAVWPTHVAAQTRSMIELFQANSHTYPEPVRHYTYKSIVFSLLELLLWYKDFITNYK